MRDTITAWQVAQRNELRRAENARRMNAKRLHEMLWRFVANTIHTRT